MQGNDSIAIAIKDLGKRYQLRTNAHTEGSQEEFWALEHITLDICKGDVVGIIGSNGSGKSTLLKILSHITKPTTGEALFYGEVSSILDIGTNFHPELTGRENVAMHLKLKKVPRSTHASSEDEICRFSEIGSFFDQPVKIYSSGMFLRLAFSVAFHLHSDILLLDEVLAVGDEGFRLKCQDKLRQLASAGKTILFVSHSRSEVLDLSTKCLWLDRGHIRRYDKPAMVLAEYFAMHQDNFDQSKLVIDTENAHVPHHTEVSGSIHLSWERDEAPGNDTISILELSVSGSSAGHIYNTEAVHMNFRIEKKRGNVHIGAFFFIQDIFHQPVLVGHFLNNTEGADLSSPLRDEVGVFDIKCTIPPCWLIPGKYYLFPRFGIEEGEWTDTSAEGFRFSEKLNFVVEAGPGYHDYIADPGKGALRPPLVWQMDRK